MKVNQFIESIKVTEEKISKALIKLEENVSMDNDKCCPYCKDMINHKFYEAGPWSTVMYCWLCNTVSFIAIQDQMSGCKSYGVATIYGDKKSDKKAHEKLMAKRNVKVEEYALKPGDKEKGIIARGKFTWDESFIKPEK